MFIAAVVGALFVKREPQAETMREACMSPAAHGLHRAVAQESEANAQVAHDYWEGGSLAEMPAKESQSGDKAPTAGGRGTSLVESGALRYAACVA